MDSYRISKGIRCKKKIALFEKNYTIATMAAKPIPVRLTKQQIERLDAVAVRMGTNRTGIIKMCLMAFLQRFERDGLLMLPTDWEEQLKNQDGRTHRYGPDGPGHRINADNVAINNAGTLTQKKKFTSTCTARGESSAEENKWRLNEEPPAEPKKGKKK